MSEKDKIVELTNEDLKNMSGSLNDPMKQAVIKLEVNGSFFNGLFLYVITKVNNNLKYAACDKYEIINDGYILVSSNNWMSDIQLMEMEYKGKFNS